MNRSFIVARYTSIAALICAVVFFPGCQEEAAVSDSVEKVAAGAEKEAPKEVKQAALKPSLVLPEDVLVVSGTPSLEKLIEAVNAGANAVAPGALPPNLASLALESMKSDLGLKDISWFKSDAPVLLAVVDPKAFDGKNQVVLLPVSDAEKALASLKEGAQRDFEGHKAFFEHRFEKVYVDTVDGFLVFTDHTAIFPKLKGFIEGQLSAWKPEHALSFYVAMEHVSKRYGVELAQFKEMAKQTLSEQAAGASSPDIQDWQTDMLFAVLDSMETLQIDLSSEGKDLRLLMTDTAKAGTAFAKLLASSQGQVSSLSGTIPANAWFSTSAILDVRENDDYGRLNEMSIRTYTDLLGMDSEKMKGLEPLIRESAQLTTGDSAFSLYTDGEFPVAMHTVAKVSDVKAFRAVNKKLIALLVPEVWKLVVEELKSNGTELPPAQVGTIAEMVALAKPFATPMGLVPTLSSSETDGVVVDALELQVDWTVLSREMGLAAQDVDAVNMLKAIAGEKLVFAVASGSDRYVQAFGPNAIETAKMLAKGDNPKSSDAVNALSKDKNWTLVIRAGALLNALSFAPDLAAKKPLIEAISKERMISITAKSTGSAVECALEVPLDLIGQIMTLASAP